MRAIILDDEPLSLAGMERMLKRQGIEVCGKFLAPAEAIEKVKELSPDAAFVDIELPGMTGLEAAERLQALLPDLSIVFVTAYDQYAVNAFDLNAVDYLVKPVQTKRLERTLERLASKQKARSTERAGEAPPQQSITLCCFHRLGVMDASGRIADIPWRTTKAKEVFAYLLHMRKKVVQKDTLLDLMWPELDLAKSQTYLHTTVYQIRQTLKTLGLPVKLSFADGGYRLELNGILVDVDIWEAQLDQWQDKGALYKDAQQAWKSLYRGDYFELEGFLWAEQERERLRMRWLESALHFARELGGRAWSSEAFMLLNDIVQRFPYVQESYFLLMQMYHAQRQFQEVRKTYDMLCASLLEETGELPNDDIDAWFYEHYADQQ